MILKFHAQTPFVRGYSFTCIYDLPKARFDIIPNIVSDKLLGFENKKITDVYNLLDIDEIEWLNFLFEKKYCFSVPNEFIDCFPKLDLIYKVPSIITNIIFDVENLEQEVDFTFVDLLNCRHLLIRFFNVNNLDFVIDFLKSTNKITLMSLDIQIENFDIKNKKEIQIFKSKIIKEIPHISSFSGIYHTPIKDYFDPYFSINIISFTESQKKNLFFNKKLYIKRNGIINNSLESKKLSPNIINYNNLDQLIFQINDLTFDDDSNISKDLVDVCKDCHYRYMCVDNRIPEKRSNNTYFHESECSYNPYISKWSGEDDYKTLKEIGVIVNKDIFTINQELIISINDELWDA